MRGRKRLSREEKKEQTRDLLLESAQVLFAKHGFEGCSIDQISEYAGFSRGAFYTHFKNKIDIMSALIETGFDTDMENIHKMEGIQNEKEFILAYQEAAKSFYEDKSNLLWMMEFQMSIIRHPELKEQYTSKHRKMREEAKNLLIDILGDQLPLDSEYPELLTDLLLILLPGLGMYKLIYEDEIPEDRFVKAMQVILKTFEII
jgi:AcrR family transcriptional regulator